MSTKPYSKLFNVVQSNILSTFQIIAKIYDDRIPPPPPQKKKNFPKNLENLRKKENLKMRISTKPCYKPLSVVCNYFLVMFLIMVYRIYGERNQWDPSKSLRGALLPPMFI